MFNLNNEIIWGIISKAKEIGMEDSRYIEGDPSSPETPDFKEILAEDKEDLTNLELKNAINELEPDQQKELVALLFIGRGDYDKDQWRDAIREAGNIPQRRRTEYLVSNPLFADYLQEALSKFGFSAAEDGE